MTEQAHSTKQAHSAKVDADVRERALQGPVYQRQRSKMTAPGEVPPDRE